MSKHFHVKEHLALGAVVSLDAGRFVRVLRMKIGDHCILCDATGQLFGVAIRSIDPCEAEVIETIVDPGRDAVRDVEIWLPLLKGGRSDDLVRQLSELGVARIVPFQGRHAVVVLDTKRANERRIRFQAIAAEAANQCGRLKIPEVLAPTTQLPAVGPGAFFWEVGGRDVSELPDFIASIDAGRGLGVLFGPEGGLAEAEAERLVAAGWTAFSLGPRILRAETAVVVGTALIQQALGALSR